MELWTILKLKSVYQRMLSFRMNVFFKKVTMKKIGLIVMLFVYCLMITAAYAGEACIYCSAVNSDG